MPNLGLGKLCCTIFVQRIVGSRFRGVIQTSGWLCLPVPVSTIVHPRAASDRKELLGRTAGRIGFQTNP